MYNPEQEPLFEDNHDNVDKVVESPVVRIDMDSWELVMHYFNTTLFSYDPLSNHKDLTPMNHIYVNDEERQDLYIFDSPELFEQLDSLKFPHVRLPDATKADEDAYINYQLGSLDDDLEQM